MFSPQSSVVSDSGLIAYWDMNLDGGADGTVKDMSRYSNDGTNYGATATEGKIGAGMSFDGADDVVFMTGSDDSILDVGAESFSLSAWVKPIGTNSDKTIMRKRGSQQGYLLEVVDDDEVSLQIRNTDVDTMTVTTPAESLTVGEWNHVVAVGSLSDVWTLSIYVNGVSKVSTTQDYGGSITIPSQSFQIGGRYTVANYLNGAIDEVRVYKKVLTPTEITALYNEGNIQGKLVLNAQEESGEGLVGWWPLHEDMQGSGLSSELNTTNDALSPTNDANAEIWYTVGDASATVQTDNLDVGDTYGLQIDGDTSSGLGAHTFGSTIGLETGKEYILSVRVKVSSGSNWVLHAGSSYNNGPPYIQSSLFPNNGEWNTVTLQFTADTATGYGEYVVFRHQDYTAGGRIYVSSLSAKQLYSTAMDKTSSENDGRIYGIPSFTTDHHGNSNKALNLNGTSDYLNLGDVLEFDKDDPATYAFWIYPDDTINAAIISKSDGSTAYKGWQIFLTSGAVSYRNYYDGTSTGIKVLADNVLTESDWNHVVVSYSGSEVASGVKIYYNNVLQADTDLINAGFGGSTTNNVEVLISKYTYTDSGYFDGKISDFRVYNRELSVAEISDVYNSYNPGISMSSYTKGAVGHWSLNLEWSNGTTVMDRVPSGNNGTATNSPIIGSRATKFDGADQFVDIGDTTHTSVKTISFWTQADDITSHTDYPIDLNGTDYISIVDGEVTLGGFADGTNIIYTGSVAEEATIPDITGWHQVVITSTTGRNASDLDIARLEGTGYHDGKIAEVRIWDRVLSAVEITQLYIHGRPTTSVERVAELNGTDQYFTLSDGDTAGNDFEPPLDTDIMIEAWVDADAFAANQILVGKTSDVTGSTDLYGMYLNTSGRLVGKIADADSVTTSTDDGTAITINTWNHVAISFDRDGNMTRYVNGSAYGTADDISNEAGAITNALAFSLGAESDGGLPLNGQLDEVRYYEFSSGIPSDIATHILYNAGSMGRIHDALKTSLVDGWDLNGDPFALKESGHDLTNNGSTTFVKP